MWHVTQESINWLAVGLFTTFCLLATWFICAMLPSKKRVPRGMPDPGVQTEVTVQNPALSLAAAIQGNLGMLLGGQHKGEWRSNTPSPILLLTTLYMRKTPTIIYWVVIFMLLVGCVSLYHLRNEDRPRHTPAIFRDLSTDINRPDTLLAYWDRGMLYIQFTTYHEDTVEEDNQ